MSREPRVWASLARSILGARWLPVVFGVLLVGGMAVLPLLSFDFSPQTLFDSTSDRAQIYQEYRAQYGADDHVLLVLVEADLARAETWRLVDQVEQSIALRPEVDRIVSVLTAKLPRRGDEGIVIEPIQGQRLPESDAEAALLLDEAKEHPLLRNTLVAPTGAVACIVFKVADDITKISDVRPLIDDINDSLRAQERGFPGSSLHLLGPHAYRTTVVRVMIREELRFAPLTALILTIVLWLLFRSIQGVLIPLCSVGLGAIWTLAVMALTGESINIINTITATLILVIGVADAIHMMERYRQERGRGVLRREATRRALLWVGGACFLTSLTTAVGFGTLTSAELDVLRRFGIYCAVGVMITFSTTLLFVPWALDRFGLGSQGDRGRNRAFGAWLDRVLRRQADLVCRYPRSTTVISLMLAGIFALGIPKAKVDNFIMEYVPRGEPILAAHHVLENELAGIVFLDVLLDVVSESAPSEPWMEPSLLRRAGDFADQILKEPGVHSVESPLGLLRELRYVQRASEASDLDRRELPESREEAAALLLLGSMAGEDSIFSTHLSADRRRLRMTFRVADLGASAYLGLEGRMNAAITEVFADAPHAVEGVVTGTSQVGYAGIDSLIRDLLRSLVWAFALIFVTLAVLLRSVPLALLSMGPNILPVVVVLGAMGWTQQHLETLSAMVFSIGLGIAVDDTIHYVARYCQEVRAGRSPEEAVRRTTEHTGRAIIVTSIVLLCGFGVLYTSQFPPNQSFAVLASGVIGAAVFADLWMLPGLLLWLRPRVPGSPDPADSIL